MANSRVGEMMITPVPFRGMNRSLYISSTAGMRKAKVLPEPVFAAANKSLQQSVGEFGRRREFTAYRPSSNGPMDLA